MCNFTGVTPNVTWTHFYNGALMAIANKPV